MTKKLFTIAALLALLVILGLADNMAKAQTVGTVPFYRLYSTAATDHFYTANQAEQNDAMNFHGYTAENIEFHINTQQATSTVALHRLYHPRSPNHFYTTNSTERDNAISRLGYVYEGVAGYIHTSQAADTFPLYRLYTSRGNDHFYTTSANERDVARSQGYVFEGTVGFVRTPLQVRERTVQLFYYNQVRDMQLSGGQIGCRADAVLPLKRAIPNTITPIQDTIRLLIQGQLTARERSVGYTTEFPGSGFTLVGANLQGGILTLEFSDPNNFTVGGACRVSLLRAQIEKTALAFPEVDEVRFIPDTLFQP